MKNNPPRISVNKLAEYMESKGGRQRQILRDQKFKDDFKGMYYREATEAVSRCLASGLIDRSCLGTAIQLLEQKPAEKAGTIRRINANIDAIESFETMLDSIEFFDGDPEHGAHKPDKLVINGVEVSVRPEIVLRAKTKKGQSLIGAVKVHFSRTFPLNEAAAGIVSALLQRYCADKLAKDEAVSPQHCFVIDVGSQKVYPGQKAIAQRLKDISADCLNIAAMWPSITAND